MPLYMLLNLIQINPCFFKRQPSSVAELWDIQFSALLSLPDAPRSVWVNVSSEVMEGSSVTLHCEVDSNPPPRISWMFGDQELLWDTASNVSLSLDDITPAQEGIYTCVGDNGYGIMNTSMYLAVKCKSVRLYTCCVQLVCSQELGCSKLHLICICEFR